MCIVVLADNCRTQLILCKDNDISWISTFFLQLFLPFLTFLKDFFKSPTPFPSNHLFKKERAPLDAGCELLILPVGRVDKMIVPVWACHYGLMSLSKGPNDVVKGP